MSNYILGIDLGTSGCKTVLFDSEFRVVSGSNIPYQTSYPRAGWAEQDTGQWWRALVESIQEVREKSGIDPADIIGVGIDAMMPVIAPVDKEGKVLRPAMIWMDRRADKQAQWLEDNLGKEIQEINGNHIDPSFLASKILWIKENEPDIYKKTHLFLSANGYLVYKLTNEFSMDISLCGFSQLCDTKKGCWSDELISGCGIDKNKLPRIFNCFDIVGKITFGAAQQTGLSEGTPVVAGAMDNVAAGLGAGVCKNGQVYVSAGTVTNVGVCIDKPVYKEKMHIYHHIIPGLWLTVGGVDFGGAGLKWFKELLEEPDYKQIDKLADSSVYNKDPLIYLPYMVGQRAPLWNNNTRGVIFGLNPATDKQALVRMFMEGMAFGARKVLEIVQEEGIVTNQIKMTGGCTNIGAWVQAMADITKTEIEVPGEMDVAPLGAALTAGFGIGLADNFDDLIAKIKVKNTYKPVGKRFDYYDKMFELFCSLYKNVENNYEVLAGITDKKGISNESRIKGKDKKS